MFFLLATFSILLVTYYYYATNKAYFLLPSPGLCLPGVGHMYKMMTGDSKKDPVMSLWRLYKKYQKNGIMHLRSFRFDTVFVGDFETLKYIYNHPECQERANEMLKVLTREDRRNKREDLLGVVMSEGKTWVEQRRFTLRTLKDFGFGKICESG